MVLFLVVAGVVVLVWSVHFVLRLSLRGETPDQMAARALWCLVILYPAGHGIVYHSTEYASGQAGSTAFFAVLQPHFSNVAHVLALLLALLTLAVSAGGDRHQPFLMTIFGLLIVPVVVSSYLNEVPSSAYSIVAALLIVVALGKSTKSLDSVLEAIRGPLRAYVVLTGVLIVADPAVSFMPAEAVDRSFLGFSSRLMGPLTGPNYLALILVLLIGIEASRRIQKSGVFLVLALVFLVWTQARIPLLIGALLLIMLLVDSYSRDSPLVTTFMSRLVIPLALVLLFVPLVLSGLRNEGLDAFTTGRTPAWRLALSLFAESPIYGNGPLTYMTNATDVRVAELGLRNAHSQLFESLATYGALGAAAASLVILLLTVQGATLLRLGHAILAGPLLILILRLPVGTPLLFGGMTINLTAFAILLVFILAIRREADTSKAQSLNDVRVPGKLKA